MKDPFKKHHENIVVASIVLGIISTMWFFLWIWDYILTSLIGANTPSWKIKHVLSELWVIIFTYHRYDLVAISFIYVAVFIPIPLAIYYRHTMGKYWALIPVWFYGTITLGNIGFSIVYSNFNLSIFYPFQILYNGYYKAYYDWLILALCYLGSMLFITAGILKYIWVQSKKEKKESQGKFGSAKQADLAYLQKHGFIIPHNQVEPNWIALATKKKKYIGIEKLNRFRHTMVIAPTRLGKGVGIAIPRILDSTDSIFVLDLKSENFQATYQDSIRKGKTPVALDPYGLLDRYGKFPHIVRHMNPFNPKHLDMKNAAVRDEYIDSLVSSLTSDSRYETQHFKETAEAILGALIEDNLPSGYQVRSLVDLYTSYATANYDEVIVMLSDMYDSTGSQRALIAKGMLEKVDKKEGGGFLSTTFRCFLFMQSKVWEEFFSSDGFDFGELIDKKVDLYFIIPTRMAKRYSRVVRLMLNLFMVNFELADPRKLANRKFEVFIDEAGQVQCTREIENILEIYGEKGMCLTTFWQNMDQIEKTFERPEIVTEADIIHIFGLTSPKSIKWIQDKAGQQTIENESHNKNKSESNTSKFDSSKSNSSGSTISDIGIHLYHANEIAELDSSKQIIFLKGYRSFIADKIVYYTDSRYKNRAGINYVEKKGLIGP